MSVQIVLRIAPVVAAAYALVFLTLLLVRSWSAGHRQMYARPQGSGAAGVRYAFFKGMLPWAKESVSEHLPTFLAGLLYHAGIFLGLLYLIARIFQVEVANPALLVLRIVLIAALLCGLGLFTKRVTLAKMWLISTIDDILSNLLVDLFLVTALLATLGAGFDPVFFLSATVLFVYVPLGKIRHCVFFFYTRIVFGLFLGRRGVLPPRYGQEWGK